MSSNVFKDVDFRLNDKSFKLKLAGEFKATGHLCTGLLVENIEMSLIEKNASSWASDEIVSSADIQKDEHLTNVINYLIANQVTNILEKHGKSFAYMHIRTEQESCNRYSHYKRASRLLKDLIDNHYIPKGMGSCAPALYIDDEYQLSYYSVRISYDILDELEDLYDAAILACPNKQETEKPKTTTLSKDAVIEAMHELGLL